MTPDLQRALAILDEMIEEAHIRMLAACESANAEYARSNRSDLWCDLSATADVRRAAHAALEIARSRLSALATTTHGEQG